MSIMWDNDSARRARLPANWSELRAERLKRDKGRCTFWLPKSKRQCGERATDVDHRVAMSDDDRIEALQSLCAFHHGKKTAREGAAAKAARKSSRYRPSEGHPGGLS